MEKYFIGDEVFLNGDKFTIIEFVEKMRASTFCLRKGDEASVTIYKYIAIDEAWAASNPNHDRGSCLKEIMLAITNTDICPHNLMAESLYYLEDYKKQRRYQERNLRIQLGFKFCDITKEFSLMILRSDYEKLRLGGSEYASLTVSDLKVYLNTISSRQNEARGIYIEF